MRIRLPITTLALGALLVSTPFRADAASVPSPIVVVVDLQEIQQEAAAYKNIQQQLDTQRGVYQKEIAAQEEKLRSAEQELSRQRTVLSPEAFAQKRQEFETQVAEIQRAVQDRRRSLELAHDEAVNQVRAALLKIVAEVAGEKDANIVLAKQQVLLVEKSLDLTQTVMERLNAELPSVKVSIPNAEN
ncbi:OmpH family outer membrane protein [Arenibaculum sp.]|jgi:Skp family chaperone for outer membrane proteins|uniref:OmpH family outer membrane protein n=1 Tax=Arenibaculum sp. TaxID=2865862 RepID=UPI002E105196|nr:OmpH family outer membrane protein [Arenibaculum sp.]